MLVYYSSDQKLRCSGGRMWTGGGGIYDVHTEEGRGSGSGGRMWTGGWGSSPMWTSTQKIKIACEVNAREQRESTQAVPRTKQYCLRLVWVYDQTIKTEPCIHG